MGHQSCQKWKKSKILLESYHVNKVCSRWWRWCKQHKNWYKNIKSPPVTTCHGVTQQGIKDAHLLLAASGSMLHLGPLSTNLMQCLLPVSAHIWSCLFYPGKCPCKDLLHRLGFCRMGVCSKFEFVLRMRSFVMQFSFFFFVSSSYMYIP